MFDPYKLRDYHAILDEVTHEIKPANMIDWANWVELSAKDPDKYRRIGRTHIGEFIVSTVFLLVNFNWPNKPQWFETMIFRGDVAIAPYCWRYATWDEASKGHEEVVEMVRAGIIPLPGQAP